jgi:hypothetical protein
MLRVRREQMRVLADAVTRARVAALIEQLVPPLLVEIPAAPAEWPMTPGTAQTLGPDTLARCIEAGSRHGLTMEAGARLYVALALAHGWDFEARPDTAWLRQLLEDEDVFDPLERVRRAHAEWVRRRALAGENQRREAEFLARYGMTE